MSKAAIILAAGESSRAWPLNHHKHKSMVKIGGKTLLDRTIQNVLKYVDDVVVVVSPRDTSLLKGKDVRTAIQPIPVSTADAVVKGYEVAPNYKEYLILNAYHAFSEDIIKQIMNKEGNVLSITPTENPSRYGVVEVKNNKIKKIVEKPKEGEEPSNLRVIGIYKVTKDFLEFLKTKDVEEGDALEKALSDYATFSSLDYIIIEEPPLSLKYSWQYLDFVKVFLKRLEKSFVHEDAIIAKTAVIDDTEGKVIIEKDAKVMDYAVIKGPAYIGEGAIVGTHTLIRMSSVESNAIVGAHSEVVRSLIGSNAHLHRSYIGDSVIDDDVKIGAGFIAANRLLSRKEVYVELQGNLIKTGRTSLGCVIGRGTVIGVQSSTMPGTLIAPHLKIKPHSMLKGSIYEIHNI